MMEFITWGSVTVDQAKAFIEDHGLIDVTIDHICYRCSTTDEYEDIKRRFLVSRGARFVYESLISGRRIALIGLGAPWRGVVGLLELCDQKPDGSQKSEFDHVEIVPNSPAGYALCYNALLNAGEKVIEQKRPHHTTHAVIRDGFEIRLSGERLLDKVKREEMK